MIFKSSIRTQQPNLCRAHSYLFKKDKTSNQPTNANTFYQNLPQHDPCFTHQKAKPNAICILESHNILAPNNPLSQPQTTKINVVLGFEDPNNTHLKILLLTKIQIFKPSPLHPSYNSANIFSSSFKARIFSQNL